jgi:phosphate-selective porin OprO/OprP
MNPIPFSRKYLLLLMLGWPLATSAQLRILEPDLPNTILVRNVVLVNQEGQPEDVTVNIFIRDGILEVVTEDDIALDTAELALDAGQGILVGKLKSGERPSFLILDGDPREDFQVLLDTATHARFAMNDGTIVRNRLPNAVDSGDTPKRSGWLAYTPPPMAIPMSYADTTKWNRWETRPVSGIFLAGLALDRQNWQSQDSASEAQVGDLKEFDGGEIRGFRVGVVGTLNFTQPWVYTIFAATNAFDEGFDTDEDDDWEFLDWRLDVPTFAGTTLSIGKQKEPISMERLMGLIYDPMQERSTVSDALLPARNVGIMLSGTGFDQRMTWAGGVFNDWIDTGDSPGDSATQYIGRVTWLPLITEDESNLLHLGLGMRYSNAKEGAFVATEPEFNQSPLFVDTGFFEPDSVLIYDFEASWRRGPFWLAGEYLLSDSDDPKLNNPDVSGYHVTASWVLTGETRDYNRKSGIFNPLSVTRSVYQNGSGTVEASARWSELDATDGLLDGGELEVFSLGLNWWLTPFFGVSFNHRWITLDHLGVTGDSRGFNSRIVLLLE